MRRYMMTAHSHFVGYDEGGAPVQLKYNEDTQNRLVVLSETYETVLTDAPLKGFCMLKSGENTVSFSKDEVFLCAEPLRPDLVHNPAKIGPWERFIIVPLVTTGFLRFLANINRVTGIFANTRRLLVLLQT